MSHSRESLCSTHLDQAVAPAVWVTLSKPLPLLPWAWQLLTVK